MPKPKLSEGKRRIKICITLAPEVLKMLDKSKTDTRSRAVETILQNYFLASNFKP